ncbi:similar to Saccharomyces cerevisiae YER016W BIM1 Microtubule-binding protein [Maudiozyma saulgeensis]|uniref:Similar to Saccharomyces cerevisiae YER016W BIM1 Microtubule-binding protein n=1 Tax=Maudiozyma saulgeensis TaxID=1789683 RepID=A0A1X7R328_9SACH|nr:similar to Saccharomyces cerevisiae YER016W BIM1 Microtubule-binding protein [Kazachstania saulgeensis]
MSNNIGESRTELLNWLNDLLKLNYKKIEECGTGAAYCQIMDSVYVDVPMHRVKFNATAEYEFHTNYKILQSCFARHAIEKTVYVERLVKCRFQDNLEFLQWIKKFWMQNKDSSPYDAISRRKHRQVSGSIGGTAPPSSGSISIAKRKSSMPTQTYGSTRSSYGTSGVTRRISNDQYLAIQTELTQAKNNMTAMDKEINTYKDTTNILERERDFYFSKLRDIEILVQSTQDLIKEGVYESGTGELDKFLNKVQQILYATEDSNEGDQRQNEENRTETINTSDQQYMDKDNLTNHSSISVQNHEPIMNNLSMNNPPAQAVPQNLIIDDETF